MLAQTRERDLALMANLAIPRLTALRVYPCVSSCPFVVSELRTAFAIRFCFLFPARHRPRDRSAPECSRYDHAATNHDRVTFQIALIRPRRRLVVVGRSPR